MKMTLDLNIESVKEELYILPSSLEWALLCMGVACQLLGNESPRCC